MIGDEHKKQPLTVTKINFLSIDDKLPCLIHSLRSSIIAKFYLYLSLIENIVQGCTNQGRKVAVEIKFIW